MKISVLANDGSPIGVSEATIFGKDGSFGCGGAELALLTLCRGWHERGYDVTLYNSPSVGNGSVFEQKGIDEFVPTEDRDVVIVFRSPNHRLTPETVGKKIWWSCDQHTIGDFRDLYKKVEKTVVISPHHANYFKNVYGIENTVTIDLPVREWEYEDDVEKVPYKCIFNSVPERGLMELAPLWERVVAQVPEASLVVTADHRLWDRFVSPENYMRYHIRLGKAPNVTYLGAINRRELIRHEMEAQVHVYPCVYEELFCISVAETQVAGVYPVTSDCGAVKTTNMGKVLEGAVGSPDWSDRFVESVVELLKDQDKLKKMSKELQEKAIERFSMDRILDEWDKEVFKDEE